MAYLDALAEIASQGPSPEDLETIKRLARVAGSTSYSGAAAPDRSSAEQPVDTTVDPRFTQREIAPVQQSDVSKRLAAIGQQQADIQRTPAHGLRRTLGNVAGVGAGVLSRNPAIGVDVSERVKDPNYYRQYGDLERQAAALRPVQTAEEKRTEEETGRIRAAATASLGEGNLDVRREVANERARADIANEALKTKSEADHAIQIKEREDRIKLLAENKAQLEKDMLELRAKLTDEENRRKAKEALQRSKVIASGMSGRVEQAKEPSPEERQAADNAHNEIIKAPDAATKERIVSGLTPKAREHLQANYPSDLSYKKLGAPEQLRLDSSKSTLSLIKEIRGIVKQRPNIIGPAIGRVAGFKGVVGVQDKDTSKLEGLLTSLFVNEASLYGTGRATKTLLDTIKEGGMARLPQLASQFEGRLKATEDAAKINYKSISGEDYKDEDEEANFKDLKITPIKK